MNDSYYGYKNGSVIGSPHHQNNAIKGKNSMYAVNRMDTSNDGLSTPRMPKHNSVSLASSSRLNDNS